MSQHELPRLPTNPASEYEAQRSGIMRLMILHLNLHELCTGRDLDNASTEECSLPILYYYSDSPTLDSDQDATKDDMVQFSLLCAALFNLPGTIGTLAQTSTSPSSKCDLDSTQEVRLDGSMLVFAPLEENVVDEHKPIIICTPNIKNKLVKHNISI